MARPKFRIEDEKDHDVAIGYLENNIGKANFYKWAEHEKAEEAKKELEDLKYMFTLEDKKAKQEMMTKLNEFCDKYLNELQYNKLKITIRQKRKIRKDGSTNKKQQVTLSPNAYDILQDISSRYKITLSEAVEKLKAHSKELF